MEKNEKKSRAVVESVVHRFKGTLESNKQEVRSKEREKTVDANNFTQRVEKKAYELYVKRGSVYGRDWDDWLEAEKLVEAEMNTVDKDCIRSKEFYKATHRSNPLPSDIDTRKIDTSPFVKEY